MNDRQGVAEVPSGSSRSLCCRGEARGYTISVDLLTEHREALGTISEILVKRETIEKEEFEALLAGKTEEDVFGAEAPPPPGPPIPGEPAPERPRESRPRPPEAVVAAARDERLAARAPS